jgi:plastocyanin
LFGIILPEVNMRRTFLVLLVALSVASMAALAVLDETSQAETVNVEAGNLYFCNSSFQEGVCETSITAGDTVTWQNIAGFHTVTECDDAFSDCPPSGGFDSGPLTTGNSFSHTFASPGAIEYFCAFHPTDMRGRVTVQAAPTPSPTAAPTAAPTGIPAGTTTGVTSPTVSPAAVPKTGGTPDDSGAAGSGAWLLVILVGALVLGTGVAAGRAVTGRASQR